MEAQKITIFESLKMTKMITFINDSHSSMANGVGGLHNELPVGHPGGSKIAIQTDNTVETIF